MKKVLIIARSFPPLNASGTFRPTKFVKYLSQFGWQPYVISADHSADQENKPVTLDQNLLNNITSDTKVWYIPIPRPKPVQRLANLVGWRSRDVADQRDMHSAKDSALVHLLVQKYTIAKRLRRILLSPLYLIQHPPIDEYLYWAFKIIPKARRIIREENIDVILTTSPPWSVLLSGLILKRITGKPWLADMRDLWTIDSRYNSMGLIKWFDRFVERITLCYADKVIGVTPGGVADLRCLLKCKDKDSIHLITNGYDPDDYIDSTKRISSVPQKIKLYHPGSVYKGGLKPLIRAVEKVKEQNRNLELTIEFVGYVHPEDLHRLSNSTASNLISVSDKRLPHHIAIAQMQQSHVLLLCLAPDYYPESYYPGKLFEYMYAQRPILAITDENAASHLVQLSGSGCVVSANDWERIADILLEIAIDYNHFFAKHYHPNWDILARYNRKVLTGKLAVLFNQVTT